MENNSTRVHRFQDGKWIDVTEELRARIEADQKANPILFQFKEEQWNRHSGTPTMTDDEFKELAERVIEENKENWAKARDHIRLVPDHLKNRLDIDEVFPPIPS